MIESNNYLIIIVKPWFHHQKLHFLFSLEWATSEKLAMQTAKCWKKKEKMKYQSKFFLLL